MNKKKAIVERKDFLPLWIIIGVFVLISIYFGSKIFLGGRQIEDQNGDADKSICIISDAEIESSVSDYEAIGSYVNSKDNNASGIVGEFEKYDNAYTEFGFLKVTGIYLCNAYKGAGKEVTYTVDSIVEKGNVRIIITDENQKILYDIPIDGVESLTFNAESGKTYFLKFVAESAKLELNITRTEEEK